MDTVMFVLVCMFLLVIVVGVFCLQTPELNEDNVDLYYHPIDPSEYFCGNSRAIIEYRNANRSNMGLAELNDEQVMNITRLCEEVEC